MPLAGVLRGTIQERKTWKDELFGLSTTVVDALTSSHRYGPVGTGKPITTLGELAKCDPKLLTSYRNIGKQGISQITKTLNACKIGHFQAG